MRIDDDHRWRLAAPLAELAGTAIIVFSLVSARVVAWHPDSPLAQAVRSSSGRIGATALMTGLAIVAVVRSPIGRLSGGHFNPVVTLAFGLQGLVHPFELVAYPIAQCGGAVIGAVGATAAWGRAADLPHVARGVTRPAAGWAFPAAAVLEAAFVALLLVVAFVVLSRHSMLRTASLVVPGVLTVGVTLLARRSGAGFNPARVIGPDVAAHRYPALAVYLVGPLAGAAVASLAWSRIGRHPVLTPKLDHQPGYPCFFRHCRLHQA